jgi:hypothetical protein
LQRTHHHSVDRNRIRPRAQIVADRGFEPGATLLHYDNYAL